MSLRLALLGLLEARQMTGYELVNAFELSLEIVWHAQHSQIYPELRKLEREGLVVAHDVVRGERATKTRYEITPAGCTLLREWADSIVLPPRRRDEVLLKSMYLEWTSFRLARRQFEAHRTEYEQWRARWRGHLDDVRTANTELMRHRLVDASAGAAAAIVAYKTHVIEGLIGRAEAEIAWADAGIELVERLSSQLGGADARPAEPAPPVAPST